MSRSIDRVVAAAEAAGLDIEVRRMGASTRTAEEAAAQCGCGVAPIGHLVEIDAFADEALLAWPVVWAAAGAHDAVFSADPKALIAAAKAKLAAVAY